MTYRVDRPLIRALKKSGNYSDKAINAYMSIPFVYVTEANRADMWRWYDAHSEEHGHLMMREAIFDDEWMPWDAFNIKFEDEAETRDKIDIFTSIQCIVVNGKRFLEVILWSLVGGDGELEVWSYIMEPAPDEKSIVAHIRATPDGYDDVAKEDIANVAVRLAMNVRLFFAWLYFGDHYWIEQRSPKKHPNILPESELKNKPWQRRDLTTMIALNRLPSLRQGNGAPGTNKRGHQRRGHWRRLENPRFRNHPKFGLRIWVKPAWIGPLEEVHEGNLYRVYDPLTQENLDAPEDDQPEQGSAA